MERKIYVFAGWENDRPIGTLFSDRIRGEEIFSFSYERQWLDRHPSLELDPDLLSANGRIYSRDKSLFGTFTDACPDRWGRVMLKRNELLRARAEGRSARTLTETDFLLGVADIGRQGGYRFSDTEKLKESIDTSPVIPPITDLRKLEQASLEYEKGMEKDDETLRILLQPGSSLGGARPKANVIDTDGTMWIAKFPSKNDEYDVSAWEKTMLDLAEDIGINVPETKLVRLSDKGSVFLSKRFDRSYDGKGTVKRIHFASAMTMLMERDGGGDDVGYLDILEKIASLSSFPEADEEELFFRAAFDIAVSNSDNHLRNYGFLLNDNDKWRLSPAYDINPNPGSNELKLNIDLTDNTRSFSTLRTTSIFYDLSNGEAKDIIDHVTGTVSSRWEETAKKNGISRNELRLIAPAFELAEHHRKEHKLYSARYKERDVDLGR